MKINRCPVVSGDYPDAVAISVAEAAFQKLVPKHSFYGIFAVASMIAFQAAPASALQVTTSYAGKTIRVTSGFDGYQSAVDRDLTSGAQAYDYSPHLMKVAYGYELHWGGRWKSNVGDGDHVLRAKSSSGNSGTFSMPKNAPEFLLGSEVPGEENTWWASNTLEPEVIVENGKWHMWTQTQRRQGDVLPEGVNAQANNCDRTMYFEKVSNKWVRYENRDVFTNDSNGASTRKYSHHEVIYAPWSSKPFWIWAYIFENNVGQGYRLYKSNNPKTFNFNSGSVSSNHSQIGNQIGYIEGTSLGRVFIRITFTDSGGRKVPALMFSQNGTQWYWGTNKALLEGSSNNSNNKNCYFLALSTNNGQGKISPSGTNAWTSKYVPTTSNGPGQPDIWKSELGLGEFTVEFLN